MKAFCASVGTHVMHGGRSASPKKVVPCLRVLYWSQCWPFKQPVTAGFWFWTELQGADCCICGEGVVSLSQPVGSCSARLGKVRGCFVLVKNSSTWISTCLLCTYKCSQASTAEHPDMHNFKRLTTHTEKIKMTKHISHCSYATDPCWLCLPVQYDHTHSLCVWLGTQSCRSNLLRKCIVVYTNKFIFIPNYRLHSIVEEIH